MDLVSSNIYFTQEFFVGIGKSPQQRVAGSTNHLLIITRAVCYILGLRLHKYLKRDFDG